MRHAAGRIQGGSGMLRRSRRAAAALVAPLLLAGCTMSSPMAVAPATTAGDGASRRPVTEVLPNGLTLVTQEQRSSDIVAVYLWVGTGVRFETSDRPGYPHFQGPMLFKGTDPFGPGYIDRTVEGQGGRSNAFTSFDYTTFQILVPSDGTRKAFELLEAMAFRSAFEPKEIDAERQVIFEESRIETDTPKSAIIRQLYGLVFPDHPYGRPVLGTQPTMNAANQAKLKAFNKQYYTPENMVLIVVGRVAPNQGRALADATFGKRPKPGYAPPPAPSLSPLKGIVCKTVDRPEQQAQFALGWQGAGAVDTPRLPPRPPGATLPRAARG